VYADSQIATVKLISTLRLADVSIQEIQNYLHEQDEMTRQEMMKTWIQNP